MSKKYVKIFSKSILKACPRRSFYFLPKLKYFSKLKHTLTISGIFSINLMLKIDRFLDFEVSIYNVIGKKMANYKYFCYY